MQAYSENFFLENSVSFLACEEITGARKKFVGSGVLLNYRNRDLILTAKHVVSGPINDQSGFNMYSSDFSNLENNTIMISLEDANLNNHDHLDLSVFIYSGPQSSLTNRCYSYFDKNVLPKKNDSVIIYGFPSSKNKAPHGTKKINGEGQILQVKSVDYENSKLVMGYDRNQFINDELEDIELQSLPKGMSGGGIFLVPNSARLDHTVNLKPYLIGIFTRLDFAKKTAHGVLLYNSIDNLLNTGSIIY